MKPTSQPSNVTVPSPESQTIADQQAVQFGQIAVQLSLQFLRADSEQFVSPRLRTFGLLSGNVAASNWLASAFSEISTSGFCPTPSSVFDTRLYSVTGSGHIRRPAALGLLLRFAPLRVPVPPKTNSLQNRHRTPSEFLSVPSEKADLRHLGAGPTPVASPCVTRANSGIQNGEQKCI